MVSLFRDHNFLLRAVNVGLPSGLPNWIALVARCVRSLVAAAHLVHLKTSGASLLYLTTDSKNGIVLNIIITYVAKLLDYKIVFHHHNFSYIDKYSRLMARLVRSAPKRSTHIMLCTDMRDRFIERYKTDWEETAAEAFVLPNAFMVPAPATAPKPAQLTIGHLSNLTESKGALRFINLFRNLRAAGVEVRAEIAGPCAEEVVKAAIEEVIREYPDSFHWHGPVYGADKDNFYNGIHVFVFPSTYPSEAQPVVLLEAMAHGAALICTNIGCIGCDHQDSPGGVFDVDTFDDRAFEWLNKLPGRAASLNFSSLAVDAFNSQRMESFTAVSTLINKIAQ